MGQAASEETTFEQPRGAYRLRRPAHWEEQVKDEGGCCGFGPRERDDVGIWISILPVSVDTDRIQAHLRGLLEQAMGPGRISNVREDRSLGYHALKADSADAGNGGHHWLIAGGDLVLFISSEYPTGEREVWEGVFQHLLSTLTITRDDELLAVQVGNELLDNLRRRFPDVEYRWDASGMRIHGGGQVLYTGNLVRQVTNDPERRSAVIDAFINALAFAGDDAPSAEQLEGVRELIYPILRPESYVEDGRPTAYAVHRRWLGGLVICYAIRGTKTVRVVLRKDVENWGIDAGALHRLSMENLARLPWPELPRHGAGERGGPMVMIRPDGGFGASRLLHPTLHETFAPALGSCFAAAVPSRDALLLFPGGDEDLVGRLARQVCEDFASAAYPISPRLFWVAAGGVREREEGTA